MVVSSANFVNTSTTAAYTNVILPKKSENKIIFHHKYLRHEKSITKAVLLILLIRMYKMRVTTKGQVTIPRTVRERLGLFLKQILISKRIMDDSI